VATRSPPTRRARWIDTGDYPLNGWLGYYGRMADDPRPVYRSNARYRYMPPPGEAGRQAPHLVVLDGRSRPTPPGATALAHYSVFRAHG